MKCRICQSSMTLLYSLQILSFIYGGYSSFFSINIGFIFIECYEKKYISLVAIANKSNMIIFIPQNEKINQVFSVYYILSIILNNSGVTKN